MVPVRKERALEPIPPAFIDHGVNGLDHVALPYPSQRGEAAVRAFWEPLGMKVTVRETTSWIDHAGPGRRLDVGSVTHTRIVYYPVRMSRVRQVARTIAGFLGARDKTLGHVAFAVSPRAFEALLDHTALDRRQGRDRDGLIRWGTHDASLFLNGPFQTRFEFHCPNAPASVFSRSG